MKFLLVATFAVSSLLGCTDQSLDGPKAAERDAIIDGRLSTSVDDAVVYISSSGTSCTGTLIAPTVVLTALHCVTGFDSNLPFTCQADGTLAPGSTTGRLGQPVEPKGVSVVSGVVVSGERIHAKAIYSSGSTDVCHDDLAVLVLESAPPIGDAPLVSLRFTRPTRKKELTRIVGYGDVGGTDTLSGRQVREGISVRGVGGPDTSTPGDTGVFPRSVQIAEGPCHGDSGGPLFSQDTGAQVGVFSLIQNTTCAGPAMRNSYTQISYWEALIREALASEGAEPILEPDEPTAAGGEGGATSGSVGGSPDGVAGTAGTSSGGSGGTGEPVGEGAAPTDLETGPDGNGRGSFQDDSCTCRAVGGRPSAPWLSVSSAFVVAAWAMARRGRQRTAAIHRRS